MGAKAAGSIVWVHNFFIGRTLAFVQTGPYAATMRVAVISDTHDKLPGPLCVRLRGADEIWHLGDVCSPMIIATLETIAPVRVVRGNCDEDYSWPLTLDFTLEGIRFHLEHIPNLGPQKCDVFLHGHTHVARDEMVNGVRYLNPGCISRPRSGPPSFAWLIVEKGTMSWKSMLV